MHALIIRRCDEIDAKSEIGSRVIRPMLYLNFNERSCGYHIFDEPRKRVNLGLIGNE